LYYRTPAMRVIAPLAALLSLLAAAPALADVAAQIDHSARVALSGRAANVFVGNSSVADAVVVDSRNLMVVGRGFGVTSLVVLEGAGRSVRNTRGRGPAGGADRRSLAGASAARNCTCSPTCERPPMPGEAQPSFDSCTGPYSACRGRAKAGAQGG